MGFLPPQTLLGLFLLLLGAFYAWMGLYAYRRYRLEARVLFAWVMVSAAVWSTLYGLEIAAQAIEWKILWAKGQYFGIVSLPVFWLLFTLVFTGQEGALSPQMRRVLWIMPVVTLGMVWTNERHHLLWSGQFLGGPPLFLLTSEYGAYFWLHTVYSYGLLLVGTVVLAASAIQSAGIYRLRSLIVLVGMMAAVAANVIYLGRAAPIGALDITPLVFLFAALGMLWAMHRYYLLDIAPLPFGSLIAGLNDAVLAVDGHRRVLYMNPAAEALTGRRLEESIGWPLEEVCRLSRSLQDALLVQGESRLEVALEERYGDRILEATLQPIPIGGRETGTAIFLRDITAAYQARLEIEYRDAILQALSLAAVELMRSPTWESAAPALLEKLGQAVGVCRVCLFQNEVSEDNLLIATQRFEWLAPHLTADGGRASQEVSLRWFERWMELFSRRQPVAGPVHEFPEDEQRFLQARNIRSLAVFPVFVDEALWGAICFLECSRERLWSEMELDALRLMAELLGSTIRREAIQQEMTRRQQVLDTMQEIILRALQSTSLEEMGQTLVDHIGLLIGADHCFFTLWDEQEQRVIPLAAFGKYRESYPKITPQPGEKTFTASVLEKRQALIVDNVFESEYLDPRIAAQFETLSMLALPLIAGGRRLGALLLGFSSPHRFTLQEITVGERAAALVSLVLLKFQAVEQAERRAREAETLRQVGATVVSTLHSQEVIERILDELHRVVPYDSASVQLLRDGYLEIVGGRGWEDPEQVLGMRFDIHDAQNPNSQVIHTLEPVLLQDVSGYAEFKKPIHARIHSWLGVPLIAHGRVLGMLAIDSYREGGFVKEHVDLVVAFANQVALALENARLYEEAQAQALTDPLTGLYNRRGLMELGRLELARARRRNKPLSGIMLDIDHFKRVNDTYGHLVGDQVLQALARRCENITREFDLVGRYGGEEFLILLPEADWRAGKNIAERLRATVANVAIPTRAGPLRVTVSLGVSQVRSGEETLEGVIERADQALYRAKEMGRNRVVVFEEMASLEEAGAAG
ncbi:MAG: diguanylate cyclase [Anaerolineae bacterium]|nr:MAG: diguanylate cyclase [Anaerolineae bacterium]